MKGLVKLQLHTFFLKPLTYLVAFVLFPFAFFLISSLFSLNTTFIGIIMISIIANVFFVFVPNYVETKNSILFKRMQTSNLTKTSFVLITALICIAWTFGSTYVVLYAIDYVNWFYAFFFTNGNIIDSLLNSDYTFFFINDLFSILDDAVWTGLFKDGSNLHEFAENNIIHEIIINDLAIGTMTPEQIAQDVFTQVPLLGNNQLIVNNVLDIVFSYLDPNYDEYLDGQPTIGGIDGLAGLINFYNGIGIFNPLSEIAMVQMENNGNHAPVSIMTYIFLGTDQFPNPDAIMEYPMVISNYIYLNRALLDWRYFEWFTDRVFAFNEPVSNYDLRTIAEDIGFLLPDGSYSFKGTSYFGRIFWFAFTLLIVTFAVFCIAFFTASVTKNFTQYSYLAIVLAFLILLFSGSIIPMAVVFSSPTAYFTANFFPTTNLVIFWQAITYGVSVIPIMSDFSIAGYVIIPISLSIFFFVVGGVFYTMQEGRFTRKVEFSSDGKMWLVTLVVALALFEFYLSGRVIKGYDQMDDGSNGHNTNYFLINYFFIYFGIMLIVFFVLYMKGFSTRSIKWRRLMPALAALTLIGFVIYITFSNVDTIYSQITNYLLLSCSILIAIGGSTYNVVRRQSD